MAKEKKAKSKKKALFWKSAWNIICNKKDTKGEYTKATLSGIMSVALNYLAIVLCAGSVIAIVLIIRQAVLTEWGDGLWFSNIIALLFLAALCVAVLFFALILRGCANEIEREDDKNYLVAVFSALTSFAALVVALVALLKG